MASSNVWIVTGAHALPPSAVAPRLDHEAQAWRCREVGRLAQTAPDSTQLQAPPTQAPPTTAVPGASLAVVQRGRALRSGKVTRGGALGALGSVFFVPGTAEAGPAVPPTASPGGRSSWHLLPPQRVNYSPAPGWPARRETRAL